jgi:hypothetical protein
VCAQGDFLEEQSSAHSNTWTAQPPAAAHTPGSYAHTQAYTDPSYAGHPHANHTWVGQICVEIYAAQYGMPLEDARAWLIKCESDTPTNHQSIGSASQVHADGQSHHHPRSSSDDAQSPSVGTNNTQTYMQAPNTESHRNLAGVPGKESTPRGELAREEQTGVHDKLESESVGNSAIAEGARGEDDDLAALMEQADAVEEAQGE